MVTDNGQYGMTTTRTGDDFYFWTGTSKGDNQKKMKKF